MASDKTNRRATSTAIPPWGRPFAAATAVVFLISSVFPVAAALSKDTSSFSPLWGTLDVGIAFLLILMVFVIAALARGRVTQEVEGATYRAYRVLIHGIFALIVVFFLFGDRITWINGLPGVGWRAWLLLYILPAWLAVIAGTERRSGASGIL